MKYQSATISLLTNIGIAFVGFIVNLPTLFTSKKSSKNISYGDETWQKLDVYTPKKNKSSLPVIIFIYGGAWISGKKEQHRFVADFFIKNGYCVVIPDYVKYPRGKFPDFVYDIAKAMKWSQDNISQFGGDEKQTHIVGFSAGAHIGGLIHYNEKYLESENFDVANIKSFVGISGTYGFKPRRRYLKNIFATEEDREKMKVVSYVTGDEPNALFLHGEKDDLVIPRNSTKFVSRINTLGGSASAITYSKLSHMTMLASLSILSPFRNSVKKDIIDFLKST